MYYLHARFVTYISVPKYFRQLSDILDVCICLFESLFIVAVFGSGSVGRVDSALTIGDLKVLRIVDQVQAREHLLSDNSSQTWGWKAVRVLPAFSRS